MELESGPNSADNGTMVSRLALLILIVLTGINSQAQNKKLDLDDLMIKGELHNDDRLLILSRQRNELKNFIKFRTNYREEILEQVPKPQVKKKF